MNPLLQKTQTALLAKVPAQLVPVVNKVVESGRKVMYSDQTRKMAIGELRRSQDPASIGAAVSKLAGVLFNQSKHTIPMQALFPATMILMLEALQFLEDAGTLKVDPNFLAACTQETGSAFLQMLGVTPEKLQQLTAQRQQPTGIVAGAMGA